MRINTLTRMTQYLVGVREQIEEIYSIMGWEIGREFYGLTIDPVSDGGLIDTRLTTITYNCSTTYPGAPLDREFTLEELLLPLQYWVDLRNKENEKRAKQQAVLEKLKRSDELAELKRLKEKYPDHC